MGFSLTGQITVTGWNDPLVYNVTGPVLPANVWSHVVNTYSTTNGVQLYVNGTLVGTTGSVSYLASGEVNILTLGNPLEGIPNNLTGSCISQSIVPKVYSGSIDEFRVYSRELSAADVYQLANQ